MERFRVKDKFLYFYIGCMCLYIFCRANVLWLESLPSIAVNVLIIFVSFFKIVDGVKSVSSIKVSLILILLLYCLISVFAWGRISMLSFISAFGLFLSMTSVILLSIREMKLLLSAITTCFVLILIVSIPVWLLYLMGVPLPHSGIIFHPNGFHVYYDYYFFRVSAKGFAVIPRFSSFFLEAGQLATPAAFLWYLNGANFSRKNIVILTSIALSFSLIGYGLVMAGFVTARLFTSSRYRVAKALLALSAVIGLSLYLSQDENSDNPINTLIVSRLEYDEETIISGYNRTSRYFDDNYEKFIKSPDKYWGIHDRLKDNDDWTYNCSGYKKFIVHRGIIGFTVFMSFIFLLFWYNRCFSSFAFFIIIVTGFFVRDLLSSPLWLSISITGFFILHRISKINQIYQVGKFKRE